MGVIIGRIREGGAEHTLFGIAGDPGKLNM
jgi:hypothetical protein